MSFIFVAAFIFCPLIIPAISAPGKCPPVQTVSIPDLNKVMGIWWRPFRSQMAPDEPRFRCLITEWYKLRGNSFGVTDSNIELESGKKSTWTGSITASGQNNADWKISLDTGIKVDAEILDFDDGYMLMYSCLETEDGHEERGIMFTRKRFHSNNQLMELRQRSDDTFKKNNLNHVAMVEIPLHIC